MRAAPAYFRTQMVARSGQPGLCHDCRQGGHSDAASRQRHSGPTRSIIVLLTRMGSANSLFALPQSFATPHAGNTPHAPPAQQRRVTLPIPARSGTSAPHIAFYVRYVLPTFYLTLRPGHLADRMCPVSCLNANMICNPPKTYRVVVTVWTYICSLPPRNRQRAETTIRPPSVAPT